MEDANKINDGLPASLISGLNSGFYVQNSLYFFDTSDAQASIRALWGQGLGCMSELIDTKHHDLNMAWMTRKYHGSLRCHGITGSHCGELSGLLWWLWTFPEDLGLPSLQPGDLSALCRGCLALGPQIHLAAVMGPKSRSYLIAMEKGLFIEDYYLLKIELCIAMFNYKRVSIYQSINQSICLSIYLFLSIY